MDEKNYIQILEDSLESKIDLLRRLQVLCQEQTEMIREITQRSSNLQVLEKQNSELAKAKFSQIRTQTKEIRQSRKVVNSYYQNMMKMNTVDPQFMDRKK